MRADLLCLLALALSSGCVRRARIEYVTVPQPTSGSVVVVNDAQGGGSVVSGAQGTGGAVAGGGTPSGGTPSGTYVLVGSDDQTEGYHGDTPTSMALPMLCLRESGLPEPGGLASYRTPGGALRRRWSGSEVALTEPLAGWSLTSREVADQQCANRFGPGWRMAEFHDGGRGAGWDFWASGTQGNFESSRFWVAISDQQANPWSSDMAMTWRLLGRL